MATKERRNYYRINYPVALEYKIVDEASILASPEPSQFDVSPYFMLQLHLSELDGQTHQVIGKLSDTHPGVASALELINRKIDIISKTLSQSEMSFDEGEIVLANLSESGMSFIGTRPIAVNTFVALKLVFPSSHLGLLLYAKVVRCVDEGDNQFDIGVHFLKMPERCRTVLAKTIIQAQVRQRRLEDNEVDDAEGSLTH